MALPRCWVSWRSSNLIILPAWQVQYDIAITTTLCVKAQVTLCRSGGPDLYDLKNRGHRHGRLMKSWQHRTDILEVCSVGKRSAVIGKPVRQSFTVKLCRVGRDCGTIYSWIDFSRVWNRKRRGTVVHSVRAFVDSVWAFVDSVRMVVKIGPI